MAKRTKATKGPQSKGKSGEKVRILISRSRLQRRITEIAREIRKDFPDEPLHLVGVLKGAVFFLDGPREADFKGRFRSISSRCRATAA